MPLKRRKIKLVGNTVHRPYQERLYHLLCTSQLLWRLSNIQRSVEIAVYVLMPLTQALVMASIPLHLAVRKIN